VAKSCGATNSPKTCAATDYDLLRDKTLATTFGVNAEYCAFTPTQHLSPVRATNHNLSLCKFFQANLSRHNFLPPTALHANSFVLSRDK
jgi:hypothetical protein